MFARGNLLRAFDREKTRRGGPCGTVEPSEKGADQMRVVPLEKARPLPIGHDRRAATGQEARVGSERFDRGLDGNAELRQEFGCGAPRLG